MLSSDRRSVSALTAAGVTLLLVSADAQTATCSRETLVLNAPETVVALEKAAQATKSGTPGVPFESFEPLPGPVSLCPRTIAHGWLGRAADREGSRLARLKAVTDSAPHSRQQAGQRKRGWIGRHPVLFGTLVGFGVGFLIGYLPGDDAVFDDFTAEFNGWVMGGVGAGTGAVVGAVVGASTK